MKISEEGNEYVFVDHAAMLFGAKKNVSFFIIVLIRVQSLLLRKFF
jgi:hypothetical protein